MVIVFGLTACSSFKLIYQLVDDFISEKPKYSGKIFLFCNPAKVPIQIPNKEVLIIFKDAKGTFDIKENSVFDIKTKKYRKMRSRIEISFIKANIGHNARFIPYDDS